MLRLVFRSAQGAAGRHPPSPPEDGQIREYPGVRFYDADGRCRRVGFASVAEAELERARTVLEGSPQRSSAVDGSTTLEAFWPVWLADARERLAEGTVEMHEYFHLVRKPEQGRQRAIEVRVVRVGGAY